MSNQAVLYMDKRLSNRVTVCEWDKTKVGPIYDEQGLEQYLPLIVIKSTTMIFSSNPKLLNLVLIFIVNWFCLL